MNYKEEIQKLEEQRLQLQQQANFELGRMAGRIELLKEMEAKEAAEAEKKE